MDGSFILYLFPRIFSIISIISDIRESDQAVASWTRRLIPDARCWVACTYRSGNYYLTQALSRHGSFRAYTKRIGKTTDYFCMYCEAETSAEHTIFECSRWNGQRSCCQSSEKNDVTLENILSMVLQDEANWDNISQLATEVMRKKEKKEREHQFQENRRQKSVRLPLRCHILMYCSAME